MTSLWTKVSKILRARNRWSRIWAILNRSSIRLVTRLAVDVWNFRERRARLQQAPAVTVPPQELENLKTQGFCEIQLDTAQTSALLKHGAEMMARAEDLKRRQLTKTKDAVWIRLSDEDRAAQKLTPDHPLVAFALQQRLLAIASAYLNEPALLNYVVLTLSTPMQGGPQVSQLWHQDCDDVRMLKVFVYLTDVENDDDGPFTFVDASISKMVPNQFFKRHLPDSKVGLKVLASVKKMIRKKGSVFVVDTSRCYHMGSRVGEGHHRLMYTALYTAAPCLHPIETPIFYVDEKAELTQEQRLALAV